MTTSPVKEITTPNGPRKFGRIKPRSRRMGLSLSHYVDWNAIKLPDTVDYMHDKNGQPWPVLHQMMLNDQLGDCTAAGCFHINGLWQAAAGTNPGIKFANAQVEAFYSASCGYVPGKPDTDQGGDEQAVLNYWKEHGLYKNGHKLTGHAYVSATNKAQVMASVFLFENNYFGVSLPDPWCDPGPMDDGFTWDVGPKANPDNGHCFVGGGYNANGVQICTWGMVGTITWAAVAHYAVYAQGGELHTALGMDVLNRASQKAPNAFKADELYADLKKFTATA